MTRRILYGEANFPALRENNGYFVDKTGFIRLLENYHSPIFLRPRRFGKSLLCSMLASYYDVATADRFAPWFGDTEIGEAPTAEKNSCLTLQLDFSVVEVGASVTEIARSFDHVVNLRLDTMLARYRHLFRDRVRFDFEASATRNLGVLLQAIAKYALPPLFLTIDEYDNFANQLITARRDRLYGELMADSSFLKTFFKTLKNGRGERTVKRIFITGVLPIAVDDLASGYNIAQFLTLHPDVETMAGFTSEEVHGLLDQVYADHDFASSDRDEVEESLRVNYNGYRFGRNRELYNPTLVLFFLQQFCRSGRLPDQMMDTNLKTDLSWVRRLTASDPDQTRALVSRLTIENRIPYNRALLTEKFDLERFFTPEFYPVSFFFLGLFTRHDDFTMTLPNLNVRAIFTEYFNQLHQIDVSTRYDTMMQRYLDNRDFAGLFADYWTLYISQLPEAVFQKVNENFYRTTFYSLCQQYLSPQFYWLIENSSAVGRTDLEMVGKHGTPFSGMRTILEFKYLSNAEMDRRGLRPETFEARPSDLAQLTHYFEASRDVHPEETIEGWLVYCLGNRGFRVFDQRQA